MTRSVKVSGRRRWAPRLGTIAAGAVGILLFPAPDLGVLAWVAFVPLLLLLRAADSRREAMLRGWLGGFGFIAATLYWLLPTVIYFFPLAVAAVALLWLPWGLLVWIVLRPDSPLGWRRSVLALAAVPSGWVLIETVRSWKPFGGPWSLLGTSQWDHPTELGLASIGGTWLLSFAIMLVNTCIVLMITARIQVKASAALLGAIAIVTGPIWTVKGVRGQYAKTRLVMFGEYIPFRGELGWLTGLTKAAGTNLVPGSGLTTFEADGVDLGPLICFESAFPDMARTEADHGAQILVYQSEDTTFQGSWEPA